MALEKSDHMYLPVDILDLPEIEATVFPATRVEPADFPSMKRVPKRKSLANLRRGKAFCVAKLEGQRFSSEVDLYRQRLRNQRSFQSVVITRSITSMKTCIEPTSLWMASASCCVSPMSQHKRAPGAQLAGINVIGLPQAPYTTCSNILAGAASLGLRRRRNRASSEPPVPPNPHHHMSSSKNQYLVNNTLKVHVHSDENSAVKKSQQKLVEAIVVPLAPRKPQPENLRKRPLIHGMPVLLVRTN